MKTWIIGRGGLLGSALVRQFAEVFHGETIDWSNEDRAFTQLTQDLDRVRNAPDQEWCITWAAGRATTASTQSAADAELRLFERFLGELAARQIPGRGVFLLTSSAGGVYAGSAHPPFTATTDPHPLGIYGRLKRNQEIAAAQILSATCSVVITRISNLFGPGQDLTKLQGLISRLALSAITKDPLTMFVPLDTLRDYIHTDDAAIRVKHWAEKALQQEHALQTRVVASGNSTSLGHVIALMHDVTRVNIPVAYGVHESASAQARDMRLLPDEDAYIRNLPLTSLAVGMKDVYLDVLARHAQSDLVS